MVTPPPFTYRQAIDEHAFIQRPLREASRFIRAAQQRDLPRFDEAGLEGLDREELLSPVGFRFGGAGTWGSESVLLHEGRIILREEHNFVSWDDLREEHGANVPGAFMPLYSYWQLLTLWELWRQLRPSPAVPFLRAGLDATLADRKAVADWVDRERAGTERENDDLRRRVAWLERRFQELGNPAEATPEEDDPFDPDFCGDVPPEVPARLAGLAFPDTQWTHADDLDTHVSASWAKRAWRAFKAMDAYATAKADGASRETSATATPAVPTPSRSRGLP